MCVSQGCDVSGLRRDGFTKYNGEYVWYNSSFATGDSITKLNVDSDTFIILEREGYAKDASKVFWQADAIPGADPGSFELINQPIGHFGRCYACDERSVYLKGLPIPGADPATFEIIDAPYAKDATNVYCGTVLISGADPSSFTVLRTGTQWIETHHLDSFVKHNGEQFKELEMPVITSGGRWACDDKAHYRDAARVQDVDYETFEAIDDHWGQDKHGKFRGPFRENVFLNRANAAPVAKANGG